jgi:hypothetical protein
MDHLQIMTPTMLPMNIHTPPLSATSQPQTLQPQTLPSKPPNRTWFLTKNAHHVSTSKTNDELRMHFGDQHCLGIDYLGITEHKLDTT